ncbi:hypothetical protein [Rhodoferax sp.]|uniref:hypothetical protein n=1 Tax=Rhodoferax sp. TaxID=50421 RepID=UPI00276E6144|nr:hypothetical protein [Rhodoferax sp.]
MSNVPQDLIVLLIFGAVLLVQFMLKHLRKQAPLTDVKAESEFDSDILVGTPPAPEALRPTSVPQTRPGPATQRARPIRSERDLPRSRRFSRGALMANRSAVQDAIVIAAILRPCHAYRPHDID